ncbi:MAG TPA: hypothetical protein PK156_40185 [Polyangium sp.]|nr:hypothetical protein [Polyangium sp.]
MNECFVCTGPRDLALDRPDNWFEPRYACAAHKTDVVLLTGEKLGDFLGRRKPANYPFEGSGLNWVINPGRIGEQRVWFDFFMAGPAVLEEVFPSESYFDFVAQHNSSNVTVMHDIWEEKHRDPNASEIQTVTRTLSKRRPHSGQTFSRLSSLWDQQVAMDAAFANRGNRFVQSPEEAAEFARAHLGKRVEGTDRFFAKIIELSRSRFAHLRG